MWALCTSDGDGDGVSDQVGLTDALLDGCFCRMWYFWTCPGSPATHSSVTLFARRAMATPSGFFIPSISNSVLCIVSRSKATKFELSSPSTNNVLVSESKCKSDMSDMASMQFPTSILSPLSIRRGSGVNIGVVWVPVVRDGSGSRDMVVGSAELVVVGCGVRVSGSDSDDATECCGGAMGGEVWLMLAFHGGLMVEESAMGAGVVVGVVSTMAFLCVL